MNITEIWDRLVCVLYPPRCVLCDRVVAYDNLWCGICPCDRPGQINLHDFYARHGLAGAVAAAVYQGGVQKAVWRMKERKDPRTFQFFAEQISFVLGEFWTGTAFDMIVPVPATKSTLASRGFNQAEELGERLGQLMQVPLQGRLLVRREDTLDQRSLSQEQRWENARKSFRLSEDPGAAEQVRGRTILLVDDVLTTGATAVACSGKLLEAGAEKVYVAAAAHTVQGSVNKV